MNRIISFSLAALALTALGQPLYAKSDKPDKEKKGHDREVSKAGQLAQRAPLPSANADRSQFRGVRHTPTVAFTGHAQPERSFTSNSGRFQNDFQRRGSFNHSTFREFSRPPFEVHRDWDRHRSYSWSNHRYHWSGGEWVIIDVGRDDDYSPGIVYAPSDTYESRRGSLADDVQAELARNGYHPGPIDGVIGGQTRDAIAAYQRDHGLAVSGRIDTPLIRSLGLQ
jgi:Putative peptidoglycan binding domain